MQTSVATAIAGALGFFTTLPVGSAKSFEAFRKGIFVMPIAGFVAGVLAGFASYLLSMFGLGFAAIAAILAVEGINHVDGLADFGDALFVEKSRKKDVLKDTRLGAGGCVSICLYVLTVAFSASKMEPLKLFLAVITLEVAAKFAMLFLLCTSKPLWHGLASAVMEFANKRQLVAGFLLSLAIILPLQLSFPVQSVQPVNLFGFTILIAIAFRAYVTRVFGGVSGDITGALNCIVIALGLCVCSLC
ncbi:MAG: adenosylcobinamide-GDP ribazoletransferase [Archaeoglobales archaeon]|nr:MAG: adenosylcobinamide-GDP ribazoletransferase [Archaeoglobales archaeon]